MLKTTLKIAALSVASLTLLSACGAASKAADLAGNAANDLNRLAGGNGNGGNGGNNAPTPTEAVADRVVSFRLVGPYNNAGTYVADGPRAQTNESEFDDSYNLTITETQDTFALVQSGDNLVMTVNGTAYTFTPGTPDAVRLLGLGETPPPPSYGWDAVGRGNLIDLSSSDNDAEYIDLRDVLDGTHPEIQGTYIYYDTSQDLSDTATRNFNLDYTNGYATVGMRTPTSVVASQTATATYTGNAGLNVHDSITKTAGQFSNLRQASRGRATTISGGELTMTVNFTANTIAGEATYGVADPSTGQQISNREATITFNSAPIVGNGFAGTFTLDEEYRNAQGITNNSTGNYAGNFFGPAADDIAGVMRFDAQGSAIGLGGFRADRDTQ